MEVSLIIPAHNEAQRIPNTLRSYSAAFSKRFGSSFEIIVVANGCSDATVDVATAQATSLPMIRVIDIPERIGKGGAVLEGFRQASGRLVLFADADCATDADSLLALLDGLEHHDIVIGSRRLPTSHILQAQPLARRLLGHCFGTAVRLLFGMPYRDTQCGAKAFRREAAHALAALVQEQRWAFDVDLLLCAQRLQLSVAEYPVVWSDQPGSQLNIRKTAPELLDSFWRLRQRQQAVHAAHTIARKADPDQRATHGSQRILALNWRCMRHPQAGGSEINIFEQARCWVQNGHAVTIVTADPGRAHAAATIEQADGITVRRMGGRFSVYLYVALFLILHSRKFDYIIDVANGIPFFAPIFSRRPTVLLTHHVHGKQWFSELPRPLADVGWLIERRIVPFIYRQHAVIAVSPTTRDSLVELGFNRSQIHIVYNGVRVPTLHTTAACADRHRIAYVGRIRRYKRLDLLVQAMATLRVSYPDLQLDIAGDGEALPEVALLVEQLGLNTAVTIHGFVDDAAKAQILRRATVFATPSMHEGWGISVIEANAHYCPAVAYNVPGLSVSIRNGETGLLAETDQEFCDALGRILADVELRAHLSDGARRWATQFSWEASAAATLRIFQIHAQIVQPELFA